MYKRLIYLVTCVAVLALAGSASAALVGHWKLDEGAGTVATDSSGNGYDGTFVGAPSWVTGQLGGAIEVGGSDWVDCGDILTLTEGFTITCWVNPTAAAGINGFVARNGSYALKSNDTQIQFTTPGIRDHWGPNFGLEAGTWQHVAASFVPSDPEGLIFYRNGVETDRSDTSAISAGSGPFLIASNQWAGESLIGMIDDVRVYDHILTPEEITDAMLGGGPELASEPSPESEAVDVPRETVLSWTPGEFAVTHDVYLGTSLADVNDASRANAMGVLVSQGQAQAAYDTGRLEFGQTYYWRIDEVNAAPDNTIFKGEVWSFTTEPSAYPVANVIATSNGISEEGVGPENTVNGSGLNADDQHSTDSDTMWLARQADAEPLWIQYEFDRVYKLNEILVWNYNVQFEVLLGFGIQNVTVEYSEDGATWMSLGDVDLVQATAKDTYTSNTTIDMAGVPAKYVRLTVNSGFGMMGQYGLSEVRILYIPAQAREPEPADGSTDASVNGTLTWRAGREAATHEVYLSASGEAVADGTALAATVDAASFTPGDLQFGTMYYWKINEVNEAEAISSWASDVWTFRTQEYAWIDDFESYDDEENRIYDSWLDGWVNDTGSTVGYFEAPFAERTIVNSGAQSMPLAYDNSVAPFYSETEKDLGGANLAGNGADTLVVNFRGDAPEFFETADGRILVNGIGTDIWGTADQFRYVYKQLSGNGSITARVDYQMNTWPWAKAGVMIRAGLDAGSTHALTAMTPGNGAALQYRPVMNQASLNVNGPGPVAPYWVRLTRSGNSFTAECSADGVNWTSITADAAASTVDIQMGADVYIGLAITSTTATAVGAATFSNITTTGNVTGDWQTQGIGVEQPAGNTPEALYVALEDSAGKVQVVTHPDPLATALTEWQEWQIPYAELSGVNLSSVRTIYIGVGDRDNPTAGGIGTIYIDDVGFGSAYTPPDDLADPALETE